MLTALKHIFENVIWHEMLEYEKALILQQELTAEGKFGWLLFSCKPVITIGRRGNKKDILVSESELSGIKVLSVDRGGQVTYHGPEQILGFPIGTLEQHTGDSRAAKKFVNLVVERLKKFLLLEFKKRNRVVDFHTPSDYAGIWVVENGVCGKIVSIGMRFSRSGITHGFALNVWPSYHFQKIRACGEQSQVSAILSLYQ